MNAYLIVTLQYDEARPVLDLLESWKVKKAFEYLQAWDYGGESEHPLSFVRDLVEPACRERYKRGRYRLHVNRYGPAVTLYRTTRNRSYNNE
jgi:hypothetical protein